MNLPNKLTILRIVIVPFFVIALTIEAIPFGKWIALGLFIVASLTDFLDGYIARKHNLITDFGKFADPLADKLLVCSALICLLGLQKINVYVVLIIISRDFIISGFRLIAASKGVVIAADWFGKVKTALQMVMIPFIIADIKIFTIVTIVLEIAVVILTLVSLVDCIVKNRKVLQDNKKGTNEE
ncbi:MAG: CDP-diacylglycerol--glycerol-3-phosphate 3-phosphatidyltransferase [Lachnospiraceae bacterium]|nr:CDP-diacylglycerol--glycerol-3-phosphate 3-phosphatidyltransferase [Lachnospiraceae bacterium]MBP5564432.1 CDP-diacylglycerol--glycerol-3-phosphate 3-phosphatidyltransferase [Lachnospiraceae bacterium]MBQ4275599.1 CDP-diacylglycerol--glycerol-3-phosphate 3-phosphatidyltransferase [Lachnospiraceae bacterium]